MSMIGLFQPSALGMGSMSHAMGAIGTNIANLRSGGYKEIDVHFQTVLSGTVSSQPGSNTGAPSGASHSDLGGTVPKDFYRITKQGQFDITGEDLDVAINGGKGLFIVNTRLDGSGDFLYTRDGSFGIGRGPDTTVPGIGGTPISVQEGYLVDKNGYYLQGWAADPAGTYAGSLSSLSALRVDPFAFTNSGDPTTQASLSLNLPANNAPGSLETFTMQVIDSAGTARLLDARFIKGSTANTWTFDIAGAPGDVATLSPPADFALSTTPAQETVFNSAAGSVQVRGAGGGVPVAGTFTALAPGDAVTIAGTAANDGTYTVQAVAGDGSSFTVSPATPLAANETNAASTGFLAAGVLGQQMVFDPTAALTSPGQYTVDVAHAGGTATSFTLDVSTFTQYAGAFSIYLFTQNGIEASDLATVRFDEDGHVVGVFDNGAARPLYRLGLATFTNTDGLEILSGNLFRASDLSGDAIVTTSGQFGIQQLTPGAHELSNVDLAEQFTHMIKTQTVFNASATAFRTTDEMLREVGQLKR